MKSIFLQLSIAVWLCFASLSNSIAQSNSIFAKCEAATDPDIIAAQDMCAAHAGCSMVISAKTCEQTAQFIKRLKDVWMQSNKAAQEAQAADTSLFGKLKSFIGGAPKKEVTSNQIYEAGLTDEMRALQAKDKDWQDKVTPIEEGVAKAGNQVLTGTSSNNAGPLNYVHIGDIKGGFANGWGVRFFSNGEMSRGEFSSDRLWGQGERTIGKNRQIGNIFDGSLIDGLWILNDLRQYKGQFVENYPEGAGAIYSANGTLIAKGIFAKGVLSVGDEYDAQGSVTKSINKPRDAALAREDQQKAEAERVAAFQANLNTWSDTKLYNVYIDRTNAGGNQEEARAARDSLMTRFPNSQYTAKIRQEMIAQQNAAAAAEADRQRVAAYVQRKQQEQLAREQIQQAQQQAEAAQAQQERDQQRSENINAFLGGLNSILVARNAANAPAPSVPNIQPQRPAAPTYPSQLQAQAQTQPSTAQQTPKSNYVQGQAIKPSVSNDSAMPNMNACLRFNGGYQPGISAEIARFVNTCNNVIVSYTYCISPASDDGQGAFSCKAQKFGAGFTVKPLGWDGISIMDSTKQFRVIWAECHSSPDPKAKEYLPAQAHFDGTKVTVQCF